jgi:hypothetical protein
LTYNKLEFDQFEELYNSSLKKNFNNKDIDEMRDEYSDFRKKFVETCKKNGYNANISNLKWLIVSSSGKLNNIQKTYHTLDNSSYDKMNKNLSILVHLVENFPYKDTLRFKIPFTFDDFLKHIDNLIVYHSNASYTKNIDNFINNLPFDKIRNREHFLRTTIGKDTEDLSDTQKVISIFTEFLTENYDKIFNSGNLKLDKGSSQYKQFRDQLLSIFSNISLNSPHR